MANPNNITLVQDREEANLARNNTSEESVEKPQPTRKSTGSSKATNIRRRPTSSPSSSGSKMISPRMIMVIPAVPRAGRNQTTSDTI